MFPGGTLAAPALLARFKPWYRGRRDPSVDLCKAGIAINDGSQGLNVQLWKGRLHSDGSITVASESSLFNSETLIIKVAGAEFLSLAFDNNMQPIICYMLGNRVYMRWFDSTVNAYVTFDQENVRTPFVRIDDVRDGSTTLRDPILSYIRNADNKLCTRLIRDRYQTEYEWATVDPKQKIYQCGLGENLRFQYALIWDSDMLRDC